MKTSEIIQRYIILKIQNGDYKPGSRFLSAKQIAIKFNTTKSTVIRVMEKFIRSNIIESKEKEGYYIKKQNLLSPLDYFGLCKTDNISISQKIINIKTLNNKKVMNILKLNSVDINDFMFIKNKITRNNKVIKIAYIGIRKKLYSTYFNEPKYIDDIKLSKPGTSNAFFSQRSLFAYFGIALDSRKDFIFKFRNFFNENFKGWDSILSICESKNIVEEVSFSYVSPDSFWIKKENWI